jgi:hypothetical protein
VIFDGDIDTPSQLAKVPDEIRAKAARLIRSSTTEAAATQPLNVQYRTMFKGATDYRKPAGSPAM